MKVLTLDQAGLYAWSNSKKNKSLFATASIYDSFSNSEGSQEEAILQLYSLDIVHNTSSSQKLGTAKIEGLQFTSLNWHAFGEDEKYPYGILASGFNDGSVGLWDANTIIQNSIGENNDDINGRGLVCLQNVHSAPVKALSFNPIKRHLIASGGVEVAIHNLEQDISDPEVFSPGDNLHEGSSITAVSWNRQVPHILGSASQNGVSVVWDLKINKAIFNFSDQSRGQSNRNVSLSWSPEIPTQFAVAYDDERNPEYQIWDLRNPKGPIYCSLKGHTKGIHSLDWCLTDPSLIITLGRDNKACIWNYKAGDTNNIVSEFTLDEPHSTIQWSPRQPEIFSTTSSAGSSTIYSLNNQIDHIPIWLRPPVGARFSFDGRLAVFSEKSGIRVREYDVTPEEDQLFPYILDFEQNFLTPDVDIENLCESRIHSKFLSDEEKEEWKFIKAIIHNNMDEIIKVIGIDKDKAIKQAEDYTNKTYAKSKASNSAQKTVDYNFRVPTQQDAEDFFNSLAEQGTKSPEKSHHQAHDDNADDEVVVTETITKNTNWNAGTEKIIKGNILVGNIEGAVDAALKCGRVAEGFLLAYSKGGDFFRATIQSYVTSCNDTFVKNVIRYLVEDEITELVQKYPLEDWKECVALLISLSKGADKVFREHMDELALRFSKTGDHNTALLCYILSKNFLRVLETFAFRTESFEKGSIDHTIFLIRTIEKLIALKILTNNLEPNSIVDRFIYELTKVLHVYKRDTLILNLFTVNNSYGFECLILKDRILSSSDEYSQVYSHKQFPFRQETLHSKIKPKVEPNKRAGFGHNEQNLGQPNLQGQQRPGQLHPQQQTQPQQFPLLGQPKVGGPPVGFRPSPAPGPSQSLMGPPLHPGNPASKPEPKTAPPPMGNLGAPKPTNAPFNQGPLPSSHMPNPPKDQSHPPLSSSVQGPFGSKAYEPSTQNSFSSTGPITDNSRIGAKASPFSGAQSIQTSHSFQQENVPEPSPTLSQSQQRPGPPIRSQPPGFKGPAMPMPKSVGGPVRASQPGPIPAPTQTHSTISGPGSNTAPQVGSSLSSNVQGGPPTGFGGPPIGGPPTGLGGPPTRGPGPNPPRPNVPGNLPTGPVQPQISQPMGAPIGQVVGNQIGGPIGGPPLGDLSGGQAKPQGFKPQMVPGRGPVKMPPKMPGAGPMPGPGPSSTMGGQIDASQIPPDYQPIYETLKREMALLDQIDRDPRKKVDVQNKINGLFRTLIEGTMKNSTMQDLYWLCQSLDQQNYDSALALQQKIAKEDYDATKEWITTMRRIIQKK